MMEKSDGDGDMVKKDDRKDEGNRTLWIRNMSKHVKALDFRNFLTNYGHVKTVKILTDGKEYFAYLLMKTAEDATKCKKLLNGKLWDRRKLVVQYEKPGTERRHHDDEKKVGERDWKKVYNSAKETIARLRMRLNGLENEVKRLKRQVSTEKELVSFKKHIKLERSKLRQEQETIQKMKARLEVDREVLNKGTEEMRGLRDDINRKLDELKHHRGENKVNKSPPACEKRNRRYSEVKKYHSNNFGNKANSWPMQEHQQNCWRFGTTGQHFGNNEARCGASYENFSREAHFINQQEFNTNNKHHTGYFEARKY